jgi:hypothetical protein
LHRCWEDEGAEEFGIKQIEHGFLKRVEAAGLGLALERVVMVIGAVEVFESLLVFPRLTSNICCGANPRGRMTRTVAP